MPQPRLFPVPAAYIICMDTIVFFYKKRGLQEPETDAGARQGAGTDRYYLIRVGLDLEGELWFGQSVGQNVPGQELSLLETDETEPPRGRGLFGVLRRARYERRERIRREEAARRLEQALLRREEQRKATEDKMRLAAERIINRVSEGGECRYVCEEGLKKCVAWEVWLRYFPVEEFSDYLKPFWAGQLLCRVKHTQFVILGAGESVYGLIESCAPRMKGIRWIVREQDCTRELTEFVEDFCVEYGLAVALQTMSGRTGYRRICLSCPEPVNILDFSGEDRIAVSDVARDSVWLDMLSSEEKRRRLKERDTGIRYFSLKEEWKPRRESLPE